eukprot:NODE_98_length_21025_cov_0.475055.p6 type:complete len:340 gc:universal NODE_98_length_21025_cov_0.475055:4099-5118(+)
MLQVYQVEFDYIPAKSDELPLTKNQYLSVLVAESDDWWVTYNLNKQQIGWTPINFLKKVEYAIYICEYEYISQSDDELTIREGDTIYVLERDTNTEGWYFVMVETFNCSVELLVQEHGLKYTMYKVGLVPSNFITAKPKPKVPTGAVGLPKAGTVKLKTVSTTPIRDQPDELPQMASKTSVSAISDSNKSATVKKNSAIISPTEKTATVKKYTPSLVQVSTAPPTNPQPTRKDDSAKSVKEDFPTKESYSAPRSEKRKSVLADHKSASEILDVANSSSVPNSTTTSSKATKTVKEIGTQTGNLDPKTVEELHWYIDDQLLSIKSEMFVELEKMRKSIKK